jgi:hypothetical protein
LHPQIGRPAAMLSRRTASLATTVVGGTLALISLLAMPWYRITGPNVFPDMQHIEPTGNGAVVMIVSPHAGARHSWPLWAMFALCLLAAALSTLLTAQRARGRDGLALAARVATLSLTVLLALGSIARVTMLRFAFGPTNVDLSPSGTRVVIAYGLWCSLAGFALIAGGTVLGLRQSDRAV